MAAQSSAAGRRWFIAVLLVMVTLAVMTGQILNRMARIGAGQNLSGGIPVSSTPSTESVPSTPISPKAAATSPSPIKTRKLTEPTASGPAIDYFRVASEPTCPSGTDQARQEGLPVVLEWKVTGAPATTLAVDGPGVYGTYEAVGSEKLNFPCDGEAGDYQAHTYTLVATGENGSTSKELTVKAQIHEIATT
ncbi:hypothetical protein FHR83_008348 [Actinoplanes campanulatus]|uniref:Uncharacterized protein n=1 Tax=Actinoplanes campanulatus TaxID=113559 RepID=A0A7W5AQJ5_9ACTN|nr:hypothetical protein [Actinoplanes campanulatus]MBB3100623.1 hypothetical protein [Actinoplanes campanulatus]GGN45806.1 hypothetical protein GCM10010109_80390 [Actinoplanes campanulatus]GID41082.1 hypothetical protein Aca09nite_75880 [Actinoplanes campanulatus]